MNPIRYAVIALLLLMAFITLAAYPHLPATVPSHWNAAGEIDGYLPVFWGTALVPLLAIGLTALFFILPCIDPLKQNYAQFRNWYEGLILAMVLFFLCIQLLILFTGLGITVSPNLLLPPAMGALFVYIGFLLGHAEPNWFVGIRTQWTLSSPSVWKKTHRIGGTLFKLAGIISIAGVLAGGLAFLFIIGPVLAAAVFLVVYSYREFRAEEAIKRGTSF